MKKVAFFDVDGTIFRSSLLIKIVEKLIEHKLFPEDSRKGYSLDYEMWTNRTGDYEKYIDSVVDVFMNNIKGVPYSSFLDTVEDVIEVEKFRTYRYTRDLIEKLKARGYYLIAISQSPKTILDRFCENYGFDKVYGRIYELGPNNSFTGKIIDSHLIGNKATIIRRAVEKENITLTDSYAVGDTEGDISMLEMVDNPICFNPNATLYKIAKVRKWKVIVERKDVIYEI